MLTSSLSIFDLYVSYLSQHPKSKSTSQFKELRSQLVLRAEDGVTLISTEGRAEVR